MERLSTDCVVVGGGLIGLMSALELHRAGFSVVVVERGQIGAESSWAGGGILSPLYPWRYDPAVTTLAAWSQAVYPTLCATLSEETGIDPEWSASGLLILGASEQTDATEWALRHDVPCEILDGQQSHRMVPGLGATDGNALWFRDIAQVRNPRLLHALRASLRTAGVGLHENAEVRGIDVRGGRVEGVTTTATEIRAGNVIVAAGAWSGQLLRAFNAAEGIVPVRGQMILFRAAPDLLSPIVLYRDHYLVPRRDGRILVGSTVEYVGFDKSTTEVAMECLRQAAFELLPSLDGFPIEKQWAGLRPGSPRGVPSIGPVPGCEGLYVNAGQFRNGVTLAPGSGRLVVDLITGRAPIVDPAPYAVS